MPSLNPEKAIRTAKMIARRVGRAPGGSLSDAINSFSQQRNAQLTRPGSSGDAATQLALAELYAQHPQLAVAEPESRRPQPMAGGVADLGAQIDEGAKWLSGQPNDDEAPPKSSASLSRATGIGSDAVAGGTSNQPLTRTRAALGTADQNSAAMHMMDRLIGVHGWTPAAAAIAAGNVMQESGFQTAVAGDYGISHGYGQWNHQRFTNLQQFAKQQGTPWTDPDTQIDFLAQEAKQTVPGWSSQQNLSQARPISKAYEGYGVEGNRVADAYKFYNMYQNRPAPTQNANQRTPQSTAAPVQEAVSPSLPQVTQPQAAPKGHLRIIDSNPDSLTSHAYPAPGEKSGTDIPQAAPPQAQAPAPSPPPPPASLQNATAGPMAQADPMSNLYDKVAFSPDVQAGYDNPQILFDPNAAPSAARGGYMKRADGGPISQMPTNELIARALATIRRRRASTGGQQAATAADFAAAGLAPRTTPTPFIAGNEYQSGTNIMLPGNYSRTNNTPAWEGSTAFNAPQSSGSNTPPPTPTVPGPAIPSGVVGNHGGAAPDAPIGGVPNAQPNGAPTSSTNPNGPQYNNTLDQALGTNNPTMDQIFGFTYPIPPPPKPQPVGPVPQQEINALYGYGGGYQMGTGTGPVSPQIAAPPPAAVAPAPAATAASAAPVGTAPGAIPSISQFQQPTYVRTPFATGTGGGADGPSGGAGGSAGYLSGGAIIMDAALNKARKAVNAAAGGSITGALGRNSQSSSDPSKTWGSWHDWNNEYTKILQKKNSALSRT